MKITDYNRRLLYKDVEQAAVYIKALLAIWTKEHLDDAQAKLWGNDDDKITVL